MEDRIKEFRDHLVSEKKIYQNALEISNKYTRLSHETAIGIINETIMIFDDIMEQPK